MAMAKKTAMPTASSVSSPVLGTDAKDSSTPASFLKRKPVKSVKPSGSPTSLNSVAQSSIKASATFTPPPKDATISNLVGPPHSQHQQQQQQYPQNRPSRHPIAGSKGRGMMAISADEQSGKASPVSFQQSQNELFSKLELLAAAKGKTKPVETQRPITNRSLTSGTKGGNGNGGQTTSSGGKAHGLVGNKSITFNQSQSHNQSGSFMKQGSTSTATSKLLPRKTSGGGAGGAQTVSNSSSLSVNQKPREPRRRINSAQFRTPSAVETAELAQVVMANASPPKVQNKLRKRASTLSLTATTFIPSSSHNPSVAGMGSHGGAAPNHHADQDYRQLYAAVLKEAKVWEKKCSSAQNQIHYERERWEEKYGELERMYTDLESSRTEANVDKMNSLLDTVQQLQLANEVFRKQLQDAGIEPDPMPAAQFHSQHLLVGENLDRTFLEENEVMKEKSLITNQKISHLSTEINNVAIAISQTINYVQLRYLTQMLDAAEHVSSQRRTRAMSNSFLSDMLSRGVKKTGPAAKNTNSISTQTPAMLMSSLQQQGNNNGSATFRSLDTTLSKSFSFTTSILNLTGLNNNGQGPTEVIYKLRGGVTDDRSQLTRQGIPPLVIQDLKGKPASPDSEDVMVANRANPPVPRFQYASPTTSQLRIFVPDSNNPGTFGHSSGASACNMSIASGSRASSVLNGLEDHGGNGGGVGIGGGIGGGLGQFRRSSSDVSLQTAGLHNYQQGLHPLQQPNFQGPVRTGGKYPYPYHHPSSSSSSSNLSSRTPSQRAISLSAPNNLPQAASSQQFLSPEMAMLYSHHSKSSHSISSSSTHSSSSSSGSTGANNGNDTTGINVSSTTTIKSSNIASDPSGE
ncbi:hypothetical protein EC957_011454 [Mortierella hygrophila]|uniref:Uncharacterized protein n=1 Tax=Mortierella hygrophila TaxID=979708 RepID=A0A9P6K861_9FUNG|nr:hypothetical protein EC957_011454 [Mortierella hygrophila]